MTSRSPSSDKQKPAVAEAAAELEDKLASKQVEAEEDDDEEDEDGLAELEDDDEDEDLVVFTAREAAGALSTIVGFVRPYLGNYKRMLSFVAFGVIIETLFNVIMPLSL